MIYLDPHLVQPGDVLVTLGTAFRSKMIAMTSRGKFSHAALCVAKTLIFEADGDGVYSTPLAFACFKDKCGNARFGVLLPGVKRAALLRHEFISQRFKKENYFDVADDFLYAAVNYFAKPYAKIGRLLNALPTNNPLHHVGKLYEAKLLRGSLSVAERGLFCSELIAAVYEDLGISLFQTPKSPNMVSPSALYSRSLLKLVPDAVLDGSPRQCTDEEFRLAESARVAATSRSSQVKFTKALARNQSTFSQLS